MINVADSEAHRQDRRRASCDAVSNANHPDSSAAQNGRDALPRAQDLCHNRRGSRTRLCRRPCGDARTGACAQKAKRTVDESLVQYIDMIINVPIVKRRQALSIQTVQKTSEVPQIQRHWSSRRRKSRNAQQQFIDKVVDDSVMMQMQVPAAQVAQKTVEVSPTRFIDTVVDIPVVNTGKGQLCRRSRRPWRSHRCSSWTSVVDMPVVVQIPGARADDPEDRGDSTTAAPGQGCEHARCVAAPGAHGSQGTANS